MEYNTSWNTLFQSRPLDLLAFLGAAWPNILPPLLVIAIEAPISLRIWLAVQDIPSPPADLSTCKISNDPSSSTRFSYRPICQAFQRYAPSHIVPVYLLVEAVLGAYLQCRGTSPHKMELFDIIGLTPLFVYATSRFFSLCTGIYVLSVRRDGEGDPYIINRLHPRIRLPLACLPVLVGIYVSYRAVLKSDAVCTAIVHGALLHALISSDLASTKSFKSMVLYSVTNIAAMLAFLFILLTPSTKIYTLVQHASHSADANRWPLFALSVLWNIFPAELATLCYRLDFSLAQRLKLCRDDPECDPLLASTSFSAVSPYGDEDEDVRDNSDSAGWGLGFSESQERALHISFSYTPSFEPASATTSLSARHHTFGPKTFFFCALLTYALCTVALTALTTASLPASALAYTGTLLPLVVMPLAVLAVLVLGMVRGRTELGALWRYEEMWTAASCVTQESVTEGGETENEKWVSMKT